MLTQQEINAIADAVAARLLSASANSTAIETEVAMCRIRGISAADYLKGKATKERTARARVRR